MTPQLRKTIDQLIQLDADHRAEDDARGSVVHLGGTDTEAELKALTEIFKKPPNPTISVLKGLSAEDLSYVMALTLFGRGDGIAEPGATFQSVLDYARKECGPRTVTYVAEKPLYRYLPAGLKRLGL